MGIRHDGVDLLDRTTTSGWERISEGTLIQQSTVQSAEQLSDTIYRTRQDDTVDVTIEIDYLGMSNIVRYNTRTYLSAPSSGVDPTLTSLSLAYDMTGKASKIVPHFAVVSPRVELEPEFSEQRYTLDMFNESSVSTPGSTNTSREFSGGPVNISADGLIGMGLYSFGPKTTPNPRSTRWAQAGEVSRLDEWQNGHSAPAGSHHNESFFVMGDAQEIYDGFTALHNHHLALQEQRKRNAIRLDAPVS